MSLATRHSFFDTVLLGVDFCDLGSLNTDSTHQSLLVEDKSIHALLQRCRRQSLAKSRVQHDQTWSGSELPTATPVKILNRSFIHKEQHVTKRLRAGLESVGRRQGPIICDCLSTSAQSSVTELAGDNKSPLDDVSENQHCHCLVA